MSELVGGGPISILREDEREMYELYRARIIHEDDLINHRMQWMIYSQAFLLATWGVFLQKFVDAERNIFDGCSYVTAFIGCIFAIGSLVSIRAAQFEIEWVRANYILMFPLKTTLNSSGTGRTAPNTNPWLYLKLNFKPFEHKYPTSDVTEKLAKDPLPGLTGSRNFHFLGHIVPQFMPLVIILIWLVVAWFATYGVGPPGDPGRHQGGRPSNWKASLSLEIENR